MLFRVHCFLTFGESGLRAPMFRYDLLERVGAATKRRGATLLAFGLGKSELRLIVEGDDVDIVNLMRGVKVGTGRASAKFGVQTVWGCTDRYVVESSELESAVTWCHSVAAVDPLASPWTSHRDLMGFRQAPFFDAATLRERVRALDVHAAAGGRALPKGWPPANRRESLSTLLRVAASIVGVLPADRKCFRLFVHLAKSRGWRTTECAQALALSGRRIRQLACKQEPLVTTALTALSDPRLCVVP